MKVLAIVLLCAVAAVQGRSAVVQKNREVARGEVPWLVHLRVAIGTSGLLESGVGSMISNNWILTTASNVRDSRFIWVRYGAVDVIRPAMVLESNAVTANPAYDASTGENNLALLNVNRFVEPTATYAPVVGLGGSLNSNEQFCGFGQDDSGRPGEILRCYGLSLTQNGRRYAGSIAQGPIARFDLGAPIVSDGQQTGILTATDDEGVGIFTPTADYVSWIETVTGLDFTPETEE